MFNLSLLKRLRLINPLLLLSILALCVVGVLFVYSACSIREDPSLQLLYIRHMEVALLGIPLMLGMALFDYKKVLSYSWLVYLGTLGLLVLVLLIGQTQMGARRWLFGIQPSEIAKLSIIMVLAKFYGDPKAKKGFKSFVQGGALVALPSALILLQPDLGTALVLVPTFFAILFTANICPKVVWSCVLAGLIGAGTLLGTIYVAERGNLTPERKERVLKATGLRPHQIRRLQVFLFPDKDLHGSGYNRRQSEIAVGAGGKWGKGYLKGEQYMLGYLPPSISSNDFIFSVLAEEAGFAGSLMVLLLFLTLFWSGLWVALRCQDDTGRLLCVGVVTLVFSHTFINIAMTIGLMPITGLPLPFISYGRTFMLTLMLAFGFVQSVSIYGREPETRF